MRHADRPLDRDAVATADDRIYAEHAGDPRPNALYDSKGNRLKLNATGADQQALRDEWWQYYFEALDAKNAGGESDTGTASPPPPKPDSPPPPRDEREEGKATQPCFNNHWIEVLVIPEQWGGKRPAYWPPESTAGIYGSEPYDAKITDGSRKGSFSSAGSFSYYSIPEGTCSFQLSECLKKADEDMQKLTEYKSTHSQGNS